MRTHVCDVCGWSPAGALGAGLSELASPGRVGVTAGCSGQGRQWQSPGLKGQWQNPAFLPKGVPFGSR